MSLNYEFVVNEKDMGINQDGKNGRTEYVEKASFSLELLKHIDAGQQSGFLCQVYCSLREEAKPCYFRIQRALSGGPGKFLKDLNTTYGSGVLTCDFEGQEFKAFLKWLMKNYFRKCRLSNSKDTFKAADCVGRQPNSEVWVFGEELQLNGDGTATSPETSSYMWVKEVFSVEASIHKREQAAGPLPVIRLPLYGYTLHEVVEVLVKTIHDNTMAGIFTIAAVVIGLHYEAIMDILGYCPIPVVCGGNRLGKTKSARAALSLIGNGGALFASVKERFILRLCARTTLPPVIDDITKAKQVEDIAVGFFNRGKDGTCFFESTPRTCPILTLNWEVLDALNQDPRVFGRLVLIPFLEGRRSPHGLDAQQRAEIESEEVFGRASSAVGSFVGLSQQLDHLMKTRTNEIMSSLARSIPELDDRCLKNYGILVSFAEKVIEMADIDGLEPELATAFFKKKVFPSIKEYQVEVSNFAEADETSSDEPLVIEVLMKCIKQYQIPIQQLLTCVNPNVSFKMKSHGNQRFSGVAVSLKWLLALIKQHGGTPPPEDHIRQEIHSLAIGDGRGEKKQFFNKYPNGPTITRGTGGVAVVPRSCIVLKWTSFQPTNRELFCEAFGIATNTASAPLPVSQTLPPTTAVVVNSPPLVAVDETLRPPPLPAQPQFLPSTTAAISLTPNSPCRTVQAPTATEPTACTSLATTQLPQSQTSPSPVIFTTLAPNAASPNVPAVTSLQPAALGSSLAQAPTSPAPTTSQPDAFTVLAASTPLSQASPASTAAKGNALTSSPAPTIKLPDQGGPNDSGISLDVELGVIEDKDLENTVRGGSNSNLSNPTKTPGKIQK